MSVDIDIFCTRKPRASRVRVKPHAKNAGGTEITKVFTFETKNQYTAYKNELRNHFTGIKIKNNSGSFTFTGGTVSGSDTDYKFTYSCTVPSSTQFPSNKVRVYSVEFLGLALILPVVLTEST